MDREYPPVEVKELTSDRDLLINTHFPKEVNLGGNHSVEAALAETNVNELRKEIRGREPRVFLLRWEGNGIPSGAKVLGYEIGWTQNGQVLTSDGKDIGSYDRLVEFGGASRKEQQMLVYIRSSAINLDVEKGRPKTKVEIEAIIGKWQECWYEVSRSSGISLLDQFNKYERSFSPWAPPAKIKTTPEVIGEDPEYFIKTLDATLKRVKSACDLLQLQECLIIRNANEFRLRDVPTPQDFGFILEDFRKWELKTEHHLVGGESSRQRVHRKLKEVIQAAQVKFQELSP